MLIDHLTIVGVGLIGGSVGLAAKVRDVAGRVVGVGRSEAALARARAVGAVDSYTTDLAAGVASADLVVVCTPVDRVADDVAAAARSLKPSGLITDAGSTKAGIAADLAARLDPRGPKFVGSHPLAGSEKAGVDHARPDLFAGRVVVVTPTGDTDLAAAERVERFWRALGADTVRMSPAAHDAAVATTSHLPHAVASALAGVTPPDWLSLTAGGFRDTTRIAAGDPELWAAIFRANRAAVLAAAGRFTDHLRTFQHLLAADDGPGLVRWLAEAKRVRDALGS